jgi:hypothetical protein
LEQLLGALEGPGHELHAEAPRARKHALPVGAHLVPREREKRRKWKEAEKESEVRRGETNEEREKVNKED